MTTIPRDLRFWIFALSCLLWFGVIPCFCRSEGDLAWHVSVVRARATPISSWLILSRGGVEVRRFRIDGEYAIAAVPKHIVIYGDNSRRAQDHGNASIVCRSFSGKILWERPIESWDLPTGMVAGGDAVFVFNYCPIWGKAMDDPTQLPIIEESHTYAAFRVSNGEKLWSTNVAQSGYPLWTNGQIVVTRKEDLSPAALSHLDWSLDTLQVRNASNGRLLGQRRLTQPIDGRIQSVHFRKSDHSAIIVFALTQASRAADAAGHHTATIRAVVVKIPRSHSLTAVPSPSESVSYDQIIMKRS